MVRVGPISRSAGEAGNVILSVHGRNFRQDAGQETFYRVSPAAGRFGSLQDPYSKD